LYFAKKLLVFGITYGVLGAIIGISISEFLALVVLLIYYFIFNRKTDYENSVSSNSFWGLSKQLLSVAVPVTFGGLAYPIVSIIDSVLVVNLLIFSGASNAGATSLFGLQFGVIDPILNIPIIIAISISASLLPNISSAVAKNNREELKNLIEKAFQITLSITLACAVCFVIFGRQILSFLYQGTLTEESLKTAIILLFLGGFKLVFLSLLQISVGVLQGMGRQKYAARSVAIGAVIKIVLTVALVAIPEINIYGVMVSGGMSYLSVFLMNYAEIKKKTTARISNFYLNVSVQECFVCLFAFVANYLFMMVFGDGVALFAGGMVAVMIFAVTYYVLFMLKEKSNVQTT
jgi:stage V sporulation protein B